VSLPVSAEEMSRRAAAAEATAAELLAAESAEQAERARQELQRTKRRLKKQKARLLKLEKEAGQAETRESSSEGDDALFEPEWLADLLADFDAGTDAPARRAFVESSVRLCASLRLQLETVQRCVVCLDGARGTVLHPCGHTSLCRLCAGRVAEAPPEARRCPVCMQAVAGWAHAFV
jgi:hypothetical protein